MRTNYDFTPQPDSTGRKLFLFMSGCLMFFACAALLGLAGFFGWRFYEEYTNGAEVAVIVEDTPIAETAAPNPTTVLKNAPTATPEDNNNKIAEPSTIPPTETAVIPSPTPEHLYNLPVPAEIEQSPIPARAYADLAAFLAANYPSHDYYEVRQRLGHYDLGPRTLEKTTNYSVGDNHEFYSDGERLQATLAAVTEHIYFWVENGIQLDKTAVAEAANRFEADYYPRLIDLFGSVWTPGVDGDPRFSVMHTIGSEDAYELGYFTDVNQYPTTVYSDSNEQEMIYLNMALLDIGEDLYYGTLVHEVQHLIQWNMDANETAWLNEGLSQLAELYVDLETSTVNDYLYNPNTQLDTWSYEDEDVDAHYAASYLYSVYLWEQLGETAIQELSRHPANGMAAVSSILQGYAPDRNLFDFTADFAAAVYLDDAEAGSRYNFEHLNFGRPSSEIYLNDIPLETTGELNQFGTHYIVLDFDGPVTISFAGSTVVNLIDSPPRQGDQMWFAPPQNDTDATLTAVVDLTNLSQATLRFNAWYDLEEGWDFAYMSVSTDDGATWELVSPQNTRAGEYGAAMNGRSADRDDAAAGWLKESVSLSSYAGQVVQLRFEVVTDSAVTGHGVALTDLIIPELGNTELNWQAQGFVQTGWQLPQIWRVQVIQKGGDGLAPTVISFTLDDFNQVQEAIDISPEGGVLIITPLTPFIDDSAHYWLKISK